MSELTEKLIKQFTESDDLRDSGQKTPENAVRYDDLVYGDDPVHQILDVYRPRGKEGLLPVIISVHGGGWFYGDKERYQWYCLSLVKYGFAVINFTYRLMPEHTFPAPLEDLNLVMEWMIAHADDYGFDTDRVFLAGDSAGGQIAGSYTGIVCDPVYASAFPFHVPEGFRLRGAALNCGIYTKEALFAPGSDLTIMDEYIPGHTEREEDLMDVTLHINAQWPPVFVMSAAQDYLKPQALVLAGVLAEKNVPFLLRIHADEKQPLVHVFHCDLRLRQAEEANREECCFFLDLCKDRG
ncbi:MAG: alpha/beta hydrolase [Solobacterium sp.]|nr:alpha/beta hydrolase [Solobacterium sp.]